MGLFKRKRWKPSKKNYLKDFSYAEISTTDINNLIGYLNEKFETLHITAEFDTGRCYLYLDSPVSNYRERALKQWFDDRSASQIEEVAISLRNGKQYDIDYREWPSGFIDWRPYLVAPSKPEQKKQEEDHKKMPNKLYIYHHDDHDGIFAARIAYEYYIEKYKINIKEESEATGPIFISGFVNKVLDEKECKINTIAIEDYSVKLSDLVKEEFTKNDLLVFLDYSFSSKENQEWLKELVEKEIPVIWIDHHQTSIKAERENTWMQKIPGIRDNRKCGTALSYLYYCISPFETMPENIEKVELPKIINYIDSYDRWSHHLEYTEEFHYGLLVKDPMDEFFTKYPKWKEKGDEINNLIGTIIDNGESNLKFFDYENKSLHLKYSYQFYIRYNSINYRCLAINRRGPSRMFLDEIKEYDAVCPFYFNGYQYIYSIFVDKDKKTPAGEIAEMLGGGGHPKAAGFQTKYIIAKDDLIDVDNSSNGFSLHKTESDY